MKTITDVLLSCFSHSGGTEVGVVYYRSGYHPTSYPSEKVIVCHVHVSAVHAVASEQVYS